MAKALASFFAVIIFMNLVSVRFVQLVRISYIILFVIQTAKNHVKRFVLLRIRLHLHRFVIMKMEV
ncbi:hypothetical protein CASFOL_042423 [Castilleja foliolosa]|uniref:ATP synthase F0 subunit 8 n=1 Tax=Castilleja foliolosa TaxID=1961234 RepID=A0ABD3BAQ1_9LAMI